MKVLSLLFSLIVIVQSFIFCGDAITDKELSYTVYEHQKISKDVNEQHTENDVCSPFCQCACCSTPTVNKIQIYFIQSPLVGEALFRKLNTSIYINSSHPVWQPPKSA